MKRQGIAISDSIDVNKMNPMTMRSVELLVASWFGKTHANTNVIIKLHELKEADLDRMDKIIQKDKDEEQRKNKIERDREAMKKKAAAQKVDNENKMLRNIYNNALHIFDIENDVLLNMVDKDHLKNIIDENISQTVMQPEQVLHARIQPEQVPQAGVQLEKVSQAGVQLEKVSHAGLKPEKFSQAA